MTTSLSILGYEDDSSWKAEAQPMLCGHLSISSIILPSFKVLLDRHGLSDDDDELVYSWQYKGTKIRPELTFALTHTMPL
jgi:hypothetical protein